jgi:hypothetical protein
MRAPGPQIEQIRHEAAVTDPEGQTTFQSARLYSKRPQRSAESRSLAFILSSTTKQHKVPRPLALPGAQKHPDAPLTGPTTANSQTDSPDRQVSIVPPSAILSGFPSIAVCAQVSLDLSSVIPQATSAR